MNSRQPFQFGLGLFLGMILIGAILQSAARSGQVARAGSGPSPSSLDQTSTVSGDFSGLVELNWVLTGVYSNTLATPTPEAGGSTESGHVGELDLSLRLDQVDTRVSGYVQLSRAIAFPQVHTEMIGGEEVAIGPRVTGTYDGVTLRLQSERFSILLSPEQRLADGQYIPERRMTRQFSLRSTSVGDEGNKLGGEYRETLWGFDVNPSTVIGEFALNRPVVVINVPEVTPTPGGPTVTPGGPTVTPVAATKTPTSGGPERIFLPLVRADAPETP